MKKILIVGGCATGKSTLAKKVAERYSKETVIVRSGKDLDKLCEFLLSR